MIDTLLIANRGEIAVRIIRTARRLGIRSVAVFSEADAGAMHVREADEAHLIGPAPAAQSYLRGEAILEVARRAGAEAIHPGYGFLSENADFAQACANAGIAFVGPPPAAIRAMGSKAESKRLMVAAGVPTVPGYHGEDQSDIRLAAEAAQIGFPVLIKASAGGGGKGMRPVHSAESFSAELAGARREAAAAFGDDRMLLEKYLQRPRHVEVQVFGDMHGRVTHLHTRDCSLQRRHQKVIEEAPAPNLSDTLREQLHEAAQNAARAVGYTNAGTVEFIVEGEDAFFLEMNTRLQVEHPVTEMITGLDLVEWQLRVAGGEALPKEWPPVPDGHAVEARLYAEDPAQEFRPSVGRLRRLRLPWPGDGVRVDAGVEEGDVVTSHYDPMIAKVIAMADDREAALDGLAGALRGIEVAGVTTNLALLRRLLAQPDFRAERFDTGLIARHAETLLRPADPAPPAALAVAVADWLRNQAGSPEHPWSRSDGWRLHGAAAIVSRWSSQGLVRQAIARPGPAGLEVSLDGALPVTVALATHLPAVTAVIDGVAHRVEIDAEDNREWRVTLDGEPHALTWLDPYAPADAATATENRLTAPIPGRVVAVLVAPGDAVKRGDPLLLLEAMKTEIRIAAPRDGVVETLGCAAGDSVEEGTELITLAG